VSDVEVTKKLKSVPFSLRLKEESINSSIRQMMGENSVESSPFRSMFRNLPTLEYNPSCEEFKNLMELKKKNEVLAENTLKSYIVAISAVSMCDVNDKIGSYIALTNMCKSVLNISLVPDEKVAVKKDDDYSEMRKENYKKSASKEKKTSKDQKLTEKVVESKKEEVKVSAKEDEATEKVKAEKQDKVAGSNNEGALPKQEDVSEKPQVKESNLFSKVVDASSEKIREEL